MKSADVAESLYHHHIQGGSKMTHTEGNWKAFTDNANGFGVTNGNTVIAIAGEDDLPENEANANLIAAAPKMLELLKLLDHGNHRSGLGSNNALNNRLRFTLCRLFGKRKGNSLSRQIKDTIARAEGNQTRLTEES